VSAGTVSRALAGSELISLKTRERIKALADEHGFRPNVLARNLRIQRTGAIGVVVPLAHSAGDRLADPFLITMLGLLADALTARGYDLLLSRVVPVGDQWLDHYISSGRVDGVVLVSQLDELGAIEQAAEHFKPLVVWGASVSGSAACTVGSDNRKGGTLGAGHLVERGCKRIAFYGDTNAVEPAQRWEGAREAVRRAGKDVELELLADSDALAAAFARPQGAPDGLFAASDLLAAQALELLRKQGLRVPEDVRVVGFDGLGIGEQVVPSLTTVAQQIEEGARTLVDLLLRRIGGEDTGSVELEPRLVVRGSS
jgi:DNA-binding LacI/PurR family transcriptional regulator